jgi:hypothetical protein
MVIKEPKYRIYDLKEVSKMPRGDGTGPSGEGPGTGINLIVTMNSASFLLSWGYNIFFSMYSHIRMNN